MIDITKIICQKNEAIKKQSYKDCEEVDFFEKYGQVIFKLHHKLLKISPKSLFILIHRSYYSDESFSDVRNKMEENSKLLAQLIVNSKCKADLSKVNDIMGDEPFVINYSFPNIIKNSIFDDENYLNTFKRMLRLFYSYNNEFNPDFLTLSYKKILNKEIDPESAKKTADKLKRKLNKNLGVEKIRDDIYNYYKNLLQDSNKFIVSTKNQYHAYMALLANLQHIEKLPYTIDVSLIKNIDDETIFALYQYATELNQSFCKELFRQREILTQDSQKNKKLQLKKSGYDIARISTSKLNFLLKYADMAELEKVINYLVGLSVTLIDMYSDNGIYILANTNYEIVVKINELLVKNIINLNFLNQYPQIFFDKDIINNVAGLYNTISNNMTILKQNYETIDSYIGEMLLMDSQTLVNNINTLKQYNPKFNKNILSNANLLDCLDLFIELGFSDYIKESTLDINENSYMIFKRYYVSKLINFKSKDLKSKIETGVDFYISDNDLDDYIINNVSDYIPKEISDVLDSSPRNVISNNELKQFDNYFRDNLTYDFNGILISKNKILRNLNCLENSNLNYCYEDLLFSAIIYGSILDYEELDNLKDIIYNKKYLKR